MYEKVKVKFPGLKDISRNYSQCYQDLFVLTMLNGLRGGRYLEIGAGLPFFGNNTALLEQLGWIGVSIDINPELKDSWKERSNPLLIGDALKLNWTEQEYGDYGYLQIDCDPAENSLNCLLSIPFDKCRFAVITFEHDGYTSDYVRERSRAYLKSLGYVMVVGDIAPDHYMNFEDWWIHPELVDPKRLDVYLMTKANNGTVKCDEYMLNL